MRNTVFFTIFTIGSLGFGQPEITSMVSGEVAKQQSEFQISLSKSKKNLVEYQSERKRVVAEYEALAKSQTEGMEQFKTYITVLMTRYVNERAEYQPALSVSQNDIDNINKLFQSFLRSAPLSGKVSVGHAERVLLWGITRLDELSKLNGSPTDKNNPELEILAKRIADAEAIIVATNTLAKRLGVELLEIELPVVTELQDGKTPKDRPLDPKRTPVSTISSQKR